MSKRAVSVLAAIVAALVAYILLFERTSPTSKEIEERKGKVLASFVRDRVDRLEVQRKGTWVVLERSKLETGDLGSWKMLEPEAVAADQDAVDQVLGELEWLSARRTLENLSAADAKGFGLSAPRYRIAYRIGGKRHVIALGNADVHGQGVYVQVEGEPNAYVVPKTLTEAIEQDPWHYRSKQFLGDMVLAWVRDIELDLPAGKVHLQREGERWWFEGEPRSYAEAKRVDDLLSGINDLRATRFVQAGPALTAAQAALSTPQLAVRVRVVPDTKREDQEPRLIDLRVGGACPDHPSERLARAGEKGAVVCIAEASLKPVLSEPVNYRQASLLGVDPSQVERFELSAGNRKLSLKRDGEKWLAEGTAPVDREAVEVWLQDLAAERARSFLAPGAVNETARLSLFLAGDARSAIVLSGTAPDRSVLVHRDQEPVLLAFHPGLADQFEPSPNRFGSLEPWASHQPSEVAAFEARADAMQRSLTFGQGTWHNAAGAALPPEADLRVRELVKSLVKLRLRAFVTERPRPEHGVTPARASLVFRLQDTAAKPTGELRLEIGSESEHGAFARIDGGRVMEITPGVLAQVRELAGGPTAAPEPAPDAGAELPEEAADELEHGHMH